MTMRSKGKPPARTTETERCWKLALAAQKRGTKERALKRVEEWARWKLEQQGVVFPTRSLNTYGQPIGPNVDYAFDGTVAVFSYRKSVPVSHEPAVGPRGGKKGFRRVGGGEEIIEIGRVVVPDWCRPIADADLWHALFQSRMRHREAA